MAWSTCKQCGTYRYGFFQEDDYLCFTCNQQQTQQQLPTNNNTEETTMEYHNTNTDALLAKIQELDAEVARLQSVNQTLMSDSEYKTSRMTAMDGRITKFRDRENQMLQALESFWGQLIEDNESALDDYSEFYEAFTALGMKEFTKKVEFRFTYTVTVSGTAKVPYSYECTEFDADFVYLNVEEDQVAGDLFDHAEECDIDVEVEEKRWDRSWEVTTD